MKIKVLLMGLALAAGTGFAQSAADGFNPNAGGNVYALALQANGKILVGGIFPKLGGVERGSGHDFQPGCRQ